LLPPVNDMDLFTNDLGLIAIVENDKVVGTTSASVAAWPQSRQRGEFPARDVIGYFPKAKSSKSPSCTGRFIVIRRSGDRKHARLNMSGGPRAWISSREVNKRAGNHPADARDTNSPTTGDV